MYRGHAVSAAVHPFVRNRLIPRIALGLPLLVALVASLGCSSRGVPSGVVPDGAPTSPDAGVPGTDAGSRPPPGRRPGTGVYDIPAAPPLPDLCPADSMRDPACYADMDEGAAGMCNGSDDDCDGEVDDGCPCTPGDVQRCFLGPPGLRGVGACEDGTQVCRTNGEFGLWGPCEGGIQASAEVCDDLDNDCNGCSDEVEGCVPSGSCPGPGDPRVPEGSPFSTYPLAGADFYPGDDAVAWRWSVMGTPCDRMFLALPGSTATSDNGQLSYTLHGSSSPDASIDFTLSGDYEVTLEVDRTDGSTFRCTFIVHVRAPGLRVELCWDQTGPTTADPVDVDLHLGRHGMTASWFDDNDCHYINCKGTSYFSELDWGYPDSPIERCTGPGARGDFEGSCPNPRLDVDNIFESDEYVPENINLDNPRDGDRFRVMVHHYDWSDVTVRPLVNVYCGGEPRGTYGADPDFVAGFTAGGGREEGHMWRVVDITMAVAADGTTTGCELSPLAPAGATSGYLITEDDVTF